MDDALATIWQDIGKVRPQIWLLGGTLLTCGASALLGYLMDKPNRPGRRAVGHWLPIAAMAIAALFMRTGTLVERGQIALAIVFATSIASLSLGMGTALVTPTHPPLPSPQWRRLWPLLLPATLLVLLAGFRGYFTPFHAIVLLIEGGVVWRVWSDRGPFAMSDQTASGSDAREVSPATIAPAHANDGKARRRPHVDVEILFGIGVLLAINGAIMASHGALQSGHLMTSLSATVIVTIAVAPLAVLPLIAHSAHRGHDDQPQSAATASVALAMLNLCLLLPIVIILWHVLAFFHSSVGLGAFAQILQHDGVSAAMSHLQPMVFPIILWRVDAVLLVLLSFLLLPVALDRWRLGRAEGIALIGLYAVYVIIQATAAVGMEGAP